MDSQEVSRGVERKSPNSPANRLPVPEKSHFNEGQQDLPAKGDGEMSSTFCTFLSKEAAQLLWHAPMPISSSATHSISNTHTMVIG